MTRSPGRLSTDSIARSSLIAEILSQSPEEAVEPHSHAGRGHPHRATDLCRFEAPDETHSDDRPVFRVEPTESGVKVDQGGLVDTARLARIRDRDLPDGAAVPAPDDLAGLVGSDRHQPRTQP